MADPGIQLGRAGLQLFLKMPTQRIPANRFVGSVPDDQTDLLLRDTETDHDLDVLSLLICRLKCRPSSPSHSAYYPLNMHVSGGFAAPGKITCFNQLRQRHRPKLCDRRRVREELRSSCLSLFGQIAERAIV